MRIPNSTYRIQFHSGFTFEAAQAIVNYLAELGISDLYASPIFKATAGSTHGYDVVDPTQLNPELGTPEQFEALVSEVQQHQMGWLQDIVPNHMAYNSANLWLMDILENGQDSDYVDFFDIDWNHTYENINGRVLAPMLGNYYAECLENGEIKLQYDQSGLSIDYYGLTLPLRIESYSLFLTHHLGHLGRSLGRQHPDFIKIMGILYLLKNIPVEAKGKERYNQISFVKGLLWELYEQNEEVRQLIEQNVQFFNGEPGNPDSFDPLDKLLEDQFYRLSFWKVGAEEINYRRFFTVNELISVKVEELKVFNKTHSFIHELVSAGKITGLRIDHIDGLYDPTEYLIRLREKMGDVYITVEKILDVEETLPDYWQIEGTSGYEFLNYVNGIFCCRKHRPKLEEIYANFTGLDDPYEELVREKKHLIIDKNLAGDVDNLAQRLKRISGLTRHGNDFTAYGLKRALSEVLALFPVYRTYINHDGINEIDQHYVKEAIAQAKQYQPRLLKELDYIQSILLRQNEENLTEDQKSDRLYFVMRMQQLTGPLMAKGVEDTLLYGYNPLLSLNEVGGHPGKFGISLDQFHAFNQQKYEQWIHSMNTTSTHDTKRGEDVRARLNILSELPEEWEGLVNRWSEINRSKKPQIGDRIIPDANDEYFLYQTLVGAYPFLEEEYAEFVNRVKEYVTKAVREAKVHTAWLRPDSDYEEGYLAFVDAVLADPQNNDFLKEFLPFQHKVSEYAIFNSLSQVLIKNTSPGVPDLYQGTELWDLSLVDPDNRRPVNYQQRVEFLNDIKNRSQSDISGLINDLFATKETGKVKLFLVHKILQARKDYAAVFQKGDYQPLEVTGQFAEHIIAFARNHGDETAIAIAIRFPTSLVEPGAMPLGEAVWKDTQITLPQGMPFQWKDAITGQTLEARGGLAIGSVLTQFPVALLMSKGNP